MSDLQSKFSTKSKILLKRGRIHSGLSRTVKIRNFGELEFYYDIFCYGLRQQKPHRFAWKHHRGLTVPAKQSAHMELCFRKPHIHEWFAVKELSTQEKLRQLFAKYYLGSSACVYFLENLCYNIFTLTQVANGMQIKYLIFRQEQSSATIWKRRKEFFSIARKRLAQRHHLRLRAE